LSRSKKFTIDYEKDCFSSAVEALLERSPPNALSFHFRSGDSIHLVVDTGLQGILLYGNRLRNRLPKMRIDGKSTNVPMGRLRVKQVRLPGVRIADAEVVTTVLLIDGPDEDALPGVDGYLGPASLQARRIEFDFDGGVRRVMYAGQKQKQTTKHLSPD
jgi:hypothetical protein